MVTPEGTVKVLDFGLAKGAENPVAAGNPSISPTLTVHATGLGVIMGTAAYMSPEQAAGKPVDKRSDIWSFGVILFEILAGARLFDVETISHTLADVLRGPIDFDRLPGQTPPTIRDLLRRCLDRNVKTRLRDIGEARIAIDAALNGAAPGESSLPQATPSSSLRGWKIAAISLAAPALVLGTMAVLHFRENPPPAETARFQIPPPANGQFTCCISISPDGRKIAFTAQEGADIRPRLWIRSLDALEPKTVYNNLVGGPTAPHPFWSPDSRFVAFAAGGKIRKVEASGGPSQTICNAPPGFTGGAWIDNSTIIIDGAAGLLRVSGDGGELSPVTRVDPSREETAHGGPEFLPDHRHFLYLRRSTREQDNGIFIGSLDAKLEQQDTHRLLAANYPVVYTPSPRDRVGHILFLRENTLMVQSFDPAKLALAGDPVRVAESIAISDGRGVFDGSPDGTLVYRTGSPAGQRRLTWIDRQGNVTGTLGDPADYASDLAISPNGTRVAATRGPQGAADIWVLDSRGVSTRLTFDGARNGFPVWSPDGSRIAFRSNRGGQFDLYEKPSNGTGEATLLLKSDEVKFPTDWSKDGRFLLFTSTSAKTNWDLWALPIGSPSNPQPFLVLRTEAFEGNGRLSPDGRWLAYTSTESGQPELYVRPFVPAGSPASSSSNPIATGKWQVSKDGSANQTPLWRLDGKEIFFMGRQGLMAVDVVTSPVFSSGNPKPFFRLPQGVNTRWDITADGKRLLAGLPVDTGRDNQSVTVVLNWAAGLKK